MRSYAVTMAEIRWFICRGGPPWPPQRSTPYAGVTTEGHPYKHTPVEFFQVRRRLLRSDENDRDRKDLDECRSTATTSPNPKTPRLQRSRSVAVAYSLTENVPENPGNVPC